MTEPNTLNVSNLAFLGDAVYSLLVRERLAVINRPSGKLHSMSVDLVRASAQERAFEIIEPCLTEEELAVYRRGRNRHAGSLPKSATSKTYHCATGVEALFGWLYLKEKHNRINVLFSLIWDNINGDNK